MKKLVLKVSVTLLFFIAGIASMNAQTTTSTFYGAKASNNANNPCKGATIRKCGTIVTSLTYSFINPLLQICTYQESKKVYNSEGNLVSQTSNQIQIPSDVDPATFLINKNATVYPDAIIEFTTAPQVGVFPNIGD